MEATRQEVGNELLVAEHAGERHAQRDIIHLYGHSPIVYWWPVWLFGFIMVGVTWFFGQVVAVGDHHVRIHPNNMLGLLYALVLVLVFLFTTLTMRGLVSGMVILGLAFVAVLLAWLDLWDRILFLIPDIMIFMNTGFYMFLSGAVFIAWALSFFVFDRMVYWRITPGQIVYKQVVGGGEQTYESVNVVFEELNVDFFKHGLLGFGACDLKMTMRGSKQADFFVPNVMFGHWKVLKIQDLIKRRPQ